MTRQCTGVRSGLLINRVFTGPSSRGGRGRHVGDIIGGHIGEPDVDLAITPTGGEDVFDTTGYEAFAGSPPGVGRSA
jgi:hypothetical protein